MKFTSCITAVKKTATEVKRRAVSRLAQKLGWRTKEEYEMLEQQDKFNFLYSQAVAPWIKAVRLICGDGKCSKRCCTYCAQECDRRDGYCTEFFPKFAEGTKEETARYKKAFDIQAD